MKNHTYRGYSSDYATRWVVRVPPRSPVWCEGRRSDFPGVPNRPSDLEDHRVDLPRVSSLLPILHADRDLAGSNGSLIMHGNVSSSILLSTRHSHFTQGRTPKKSGTGSSLPNRVEELLDVSVPVLPLANGSRDGTREWSRGGPLGFPVPRQKTRKTGVGPPTPVQNKEVSGSRRVSSTVSTGGRGRDCEFTRGTVNEQKE